MLIVVTMTTVVIVTGAMSIYILFTLNRQMTLLTEKVDLARYAQVTFKIQVQEWKNILLRGNDVTEFKKYRAKFTQKGEEIQSILQRLEDYTENGSDLQLQIHDLQESLTTLEKEYLKGLKEYSSDNINSAQIVDNSVRGIDREPTEKMDKLVEHIKETNAEETESMQKYFVSLSLAVVVIGILAGIILSMVVANSINKPLGNMIGRVKDLSEGEGDLTQRLNLNTKDELGLMAGYLDKFLNQIHEIVKTLAENSSSVLQSAEILTESSESMSTSSEELSQQAQSIAASVVQMDKNLQVVSSSVEEMTLSIAEMARKASEGAVITNNAAERSQSMNEDILDLGNNATEIGGVIDSIVAIATQTNLLALNASIEAAGAGEAGKGFAVVASEVKELARQAAESSEDIRSRIQNVQKSVETSVKGIGEISEVITNVTEINNIIASSVEEQSITSKELANNVSQVSIASNEIAKNIENISQATALTSQDAGNTNKEAKNLKQLSEDLRKIVVRFKV